MPATLNRFTERATLQGRVDRGAGIIYGAKVLGRHSKNGREYTEAAMRKAVGLYDGVRVYVNHPDSDRIGEDRSFHDWAGVLRKPRYESGAIFADIHLRKQSPHFGEVMEAAESFDAHFGMSHVADGESRHDRSRGIEIVEEIKTVFSVDIVCNPATASGLFESTRKPSSPFSGPIQKELDDIASLLKGFAKVANDHVEKAFRLGDSSHSSDLSGPLSVIVNELVAWIHKPETGVRNGQQTAQTVRNIAEAIDNVLRNPTQWMGREAIAQALDELSALINDLGKSEAELAREVADSQHTIESIRRSFGNAAPANDELSEEIRRHFGKYNHDSERFAKRLR